MDLPCYIGGEPVSGEGEIAVTNPWDGSLVGTVASLTQTDAERAVATARSAFCKLTRHERSVILSRARDVFTERADEFAQLITSESGLCLRDSTYEIGRCRDVLHFASMEALRDDGQIFSCDLTEHGKQRKIFTTREPHAALVAITPFNHPMNQVLHKVAPAIAAGVPMILKPSEKTPLSAIRVAEVLYQCGLPGDLLSVVLGPTAEVAETLVRHPDVEVVAFTGSVAIGKRIAATAGYKRLVLELGGNSPLIVLEDADLNLAARLAAEGSFRNSGQRCTAVKRILVQESVRADFTKLLVENARAFTTGDPMDPLTSVGTVIDEDAAKHLEHLLGQAVADGARVLLGGDRQGASLPATVIEEVPRDTNMVCQEAFGPLAPVISVTDLDDAIEVANSTPYGLSCGVITDSLDQARRAIRSIRTGTVNINEVPGYRIESSPFGGVKDSGLGVKEGVIETIKYMTTVKTFSLPW